MVEKSVFIPALSAVSYIEVLVVFTIASIAYFLAFNNFEKHLPVKRRITKLFVVVGALTVFGTLFGRHVFWGLIILMTVGQIYLHGWYFPKQGVNGLTAEPYDRYLEVIEKMKGNHQT